MSMAEVATDLRRTVDSATERLKRFHLTARESLLPLGNGRRRR
jgi:hypothetical protein